ncbi:hypothetical protein LVD15_22240 [Fulvivirga maritima]|uniref:hypothetical protein n=1 Tax=Fulvivirga maritima TaxID=2904247 RepID=UPI001F45910E|nr:hypothetical protein [Fulvivirga maritima]UII25995.1 hypothetical protein LVD15_22240 [Fulvivirga maritima]
MIKIRRIKSVFLLVGVIVIAQCTVDALKDYEVVETDRKVGSRAAGSALDKTYQDSLMVFFEQGFNKTTIKIKVGGKELFKRKITTHEDVGLADVMNVGYSKEVRKFNISIDNGKYIPIKVITPNKYVAINYFGDTVYVDYMKFYPMYE